MYLKGRLLLLLSSNSSLTINVSIKAQTSPPEVKMLKLKN